MSSLSTSDKCHSDTVILFNKPMNVLCQFSGGDGRKTLAEFIDRPGFYPAGRLDLDSEGLMVLTSNGPLQARISDPAFRLTKRYLVQVEGLIDDIALGRLGSGVELRDGWTATAQAEAIDPPELWPRDPPVRFRQSIPTSWLALTITEGRNRQVRRMTAACGFPTLRLVRQAVGDWSLEDLQPGEWRSAETSPVLLRRPKYTSQRMKGRQ